jgi:hypothetical protein
MDLSRKIQFGLIFITGSLKLQKKKNASSLAAAPFGVV